MKQSKITMPPWGIKLTCAVIAGTAAISAFIGAFYAFLVVLAVGDKWALPFVAIALVATYSGIPVMAKWINERLLAALSILSKRGHALSVPAKSIRP